MTGTAGSHGMYGIIGVAQGALFSMAGNACREIGQTNVRFNEVYLGFRVEIDEVAENSNSSHPMKASDFAAHYQKLLDRPDIRSCRVNFLKFEDVDELKFDRKI